jgi:hypothetical protein
MLRPLDGDLGSQHGAEQIEFRAAQARAGGRRRADRTVMFDEQHSRVVVGIVDHFGEIALFGANASESFHTIA